MNTDKKALEALQIYIEIGQNIAIVEPVDPKKKETLRKFEEEIILTQPTIYIDFDGIDNICDLTKKILEQCKSIVSVDNSIDLDIFKVDCTCNYHGLDIALNMLQGISNQIGKSVFLFFKNYTHVLKIKDGKRIQEHMRSILQHQQDTLCIFTGKEKEGLNEIFLNPDAPFFRFVNMIDMGHDF